MKKHHHTFCPIKTIHQLSMIKDLLEDLALRGDLVILRSAQRAMIEKAINVIIDLKPLLKNK